MEILARAVGRRKEAVAQVQLIRGTGQFIINTKSAQEYLQNDSCAILDVQAPFEILKKNSLNNGSEGQQKSFWAEPKNVFSTEGAKKDTNVLSTEYGLTIDTIVKVKGGGLKGQAEAIRLGIARALCLLDTNAAGGADNNNGAQSNQEQVAFSLASSDNASSNASYGTTAVTLGNNSVGLRKQLKDKGYLTQDSRVKERRKYGLKKARKASQYHKR
jgi:small subunit ribosomal protein S9